MAAAIGPDLILLDHQLPGTTGAEVCRRRLQAATSPSADQEALAELLPPDLADLAPLLMATLGERQDAPMAGLVRLLERSLADPRRLRALLRFQAAVLTHEALTADAGRFT